MNSTHDAGPPLLLAEQLALVASRPDRHRPPRGGRDAVNACLAGLLLAEIVLDDRPPSALLDKAASVLAARGPKVRRVLSSMDRDLRAQAGLGTWDLVTSGLDLDEAEPRASLVLALQHAAASDDVLSLRTAMLLSFAGPARLLEVVAPARSERRDVRRRIDHALDGTAVDELRRSVVRVIFDDESAGAVFATGAGA